MFAFIYSGVLDQDCKTALAGWTGNTKTTHPGYTHACRMLMLNNGWKDGSKKHVCTHGGRGRGGPNKNFSRQSEEERFRSFRKGVICSKTTEQPLAEEYRGFFHMHLLINIFQNFWKSNCTGPAHVCSEIQGTLLERSVWHDHEDEEQLWVQGR